MAVAELVWVVEKSYMRQEGDERVARSGEATRSG